MEANDIKWLHNSIFQPYTEKAILILPRTLSVLLCCTTLWVWWKHVYWL